MQRLKSFGKYLLLSVAVYLVIGLAFALFVACVTGDPAGAILDFKGFSSMVLYWPIMLLAAFVMARAG